MERKRAAADGDGSVNTDWQTLQRSLAPGLTTLSGRLKRLSQCGHFTSITYLQKGAPGTRQSAVGPRGCPYQSMREKIFSQVRQHAEKERLPGEQAAFSDFPHLPERFRFEKGKARGGGTAPPGPKRAEKPRFFRETTGRKLNLLQKEREGIPLTDAMP